MLFCLYLPFIIMSLVKVGLYDFERREPPRAALKILFERVEMKKEQLLDLYHQMVLIRRVEERGAELYQAGKIGGFMHLYIGQEAVSTGLIAAREPRDRVITAYRDHGVAINCGIPAELVMAELLGKATGMSKGKGGSMHMAEHRKELVGRPRHRGRSPADRSWPGAR